MSWPDLDLLGVCLIQEKMLSAIGIFQQKALTLLAYGILWTL